MTITLIHGDCLLEMAKLPPNSVDSIVTDPPYGLNFMGKTWDHGVPSIAIWTEALRVLKPGGHLLAFAGTRTQHRMACAIEDAGFEIRDQIGWCYLSGFPKSHDISKALDKDCGATREVIGEKSAGMGSGKTFGMLQTEGDNQAAAKTIPTSTPAPDNAKQWEGWGTALKPSWEPITIARKAPEGTVADNVLKYGTGGINIDASRIGDRISVVTKSTGEVVSENTSMGGPNYGRTPTPDTKTGRWPPNIILDGTPEVFAQFPESVRETAMRFFYVPKASQADRNHGLEEFESKHVGVAAGPGGWKGSEKKNTHPTVKPTDLMRYLCKLVTPPSGCVLDPFMGSGSTGRGAILEGFSFVGIELDREYLDLAHARIRAVNTAEPPPSSKNPLIGVPASPGP